LRHRIARIRSYDADVVIRGERYADALDAGEAYAAESHAMRINAYDQAGTNTRRSFRRRPCCRTSFVCSSSPAAPLRSQPCLSGRYKPARDEHVAVVLCGANTDR